MNDIARIEPTALPVITESATILQVIERAAQNPAVDIDKMERLLQMHERILARTSQAAYAAALARMQQDLPVISERGSIKDGQGNVRSTYALWEDIVGIITPILARHGFSLSFRTSNDSGGVTVTGVLTHEQGHGEQTSLTLPTDNSGSKNAVQALGSSTSYGKRYTASALLNLRTGETDDDAQSAAPANKHDPRDGMPPADPAMVAIAVGRMLGALNKDADEDSVALACFDVHTDLARDNSLYIAAGDALKSQRKGSKSVWHKMVARGKEIAHDPAFMSANGRA